MSWIISGENILVEAWWVVTCCCVVASYVVPCYCLDAFMPFASSLPATATAAAAAAAALLPSTTITGTTALMTSVVLLPTTPTTTVTTSIPLSWPMWPPLSIMKQAPSYSSRSQHYVASLMPLNIINNCITVVALNLYFNIKMDFVVVYSKIIITGIIKRPGCSPHCRICNEKRIQIRTHMPRNIIKLHLKQNKTKQNICNIIIRSFD